MTALVLSGCVKEPSPTAPTVLPTQNIPTPTPAPTSTPTPAPVIQAAETAELTVGEKQQLSLMFSVTTGGLVFSSEGAVSVKDGMLSADMPGEGTVTAVSDIDSSVKHSVTVTVKKPQPTGLLLSHSSVQLGISKTVTITATVLPEGCDASVKWSISGNTATVDNGKIQGIRPGTAVITAVCGGFTAECIVVVTEREPLKPLGEIQAPRYELDDGWLKRETTSDSAVIMLTGDIMCLSAQQSRAKKGGTYNFNHSFCLVKDIFAGADFVMGNLETAVSQSSPYSIEKKNIGGQPNCNAPATLLDALRYAGYDAVATANNHTLDAGENGVAETLSLLDRYNIYHTGSYFSKDEKRFLLADINGIKTAFISYTSIMNKRSAVTADRYKELITDYSLVTALVADARAAGAEYVIAFEHWGNANTHTVTDKQKRRAQLLADAGVDFIAGSHPHCLQGWEELTAADGRSVPCVYSMGNFVSSMGSTINNDTVILKLTLTRTAEGISTEWGYIGGRVTVYNEKSHCIVPVRPGFNGGLDTFGAAIGRINGVLGKEKEISAP